MYEDELPEDLPNELYDWWFNNSHVEGVRIGPIIEDNSRISGTKLRCTNCGNIAPASYVEGDGCYCGGVFRTMKNNA